MFYSVKLSVENGLDGRIASSAKDWGFNDSSDDSFDTLMTELAENSVSGEVDKKPSLYESWFRDEYEIWHQL